MSENNKTLSDIIRSSLEEIGSSFGADTVIGTPINTESGTTIIPISKVTVGIVSGGMDINSNDQKLGGGAGSGISVAPMGFLVVKPDGSVELLNVCLNDKSDDAFSQIAGLIEKSPDLVSRFKDVFSKKKEGK